MKAFDFDDGGSFDRLVKEAEEAAKGDKDLKQRLLGERVLRDFMDYMKDKAQHVASRPPPKVLSFDVPKSTSSGTCSGGSSQNKKRSFDDEQMIQTNNEDNIVREPEKLKKKSKKKKRKIKMATNNNNNNNNARVIPEMPERFKNKIEEMGGSKIMRVIQKKLKKCDTEQNNNRLAVPVKQIERVFLEADEIERVVDRNQPMEKVKLIEPCLSRVTEVTLQKWDMGNNYTLNLRETWYKEVICNDVNRLQIGAEVQLYAFRRVENNNELCFALVNLDLAI